MQSSSQGRQGYPQYQGYPYVNPVVHDVPSIDAQTASKWANLPRRPIQDTPTAVHVVENSSGGGSSQAPQSSSQGSRQTNRYQGYPYVKPVYTDVSGSVSPTSSGGAGGFGGSSLQTTQRLQTSSNDTVPPKRDVDANPVVYIDLPEAGSEVSRSIVTPDDDEPEFVQNTIMYDPFENRRIDMAKDEELRSATSSETGSTAPYSPQYQHARPVHMRPSTLNIAGGSGSGAQPSSSSSRQPPGLPAFMSKESQVYGGADGADGFPISPIPISEFPEPPPAYTEVAETPAVREPVVEPPPPPRTQVIVNDRAMSPMYQGPMNGPTSPMNQGPINSPMSMNRGSIGGSMNQGSITGSMSPGANNGSTVVPYGDGSSISVIVGRQNTEQKYLICIHCGARVHTIVDKTSGALTHFIACLVMFIFLPMVVFVYISDYFKYKNHYCPSCFKLIGYETPVVGKKVNYVSL